MAILRELTDIVDTIASPSLAETWDNTGLQVGHRQWPVRKVWVALDPSEKLIDKASAQGIDLVITHHPLIFAPLSTIDLETTIGRTIATALANQVAIYCCHTNLDSADGGLNDMLANRLGVYDTIALRPKERDVYRLAIVMSKTGQRAIFKTLLDLGVKEPRDSARVETKGGANVRFECLVDNKNLSAVLGMLNDAQIEQQLFYDLCPLRRRLGKEGLGRVGSLESEITLDDLVSRVKKDLDISTVKVVGDPNLMIKRVALCSGSGKSLLNDFFSSDAQVYITGELGYHDGQNAADRGRALIDVGHFATERIVANGLVARLRKLLVEKSLSKVSVDPYVEEIDCFSYV